MRKTVWKCGDFMGGLLWINNPPFMKTLENDKWNVRDVSGIIENEI